MATIANVCLRSALRGSKALTTSSRSISVATPTLKEYVMNDPLEHATGLEKYELLAKQAGNDDPFFMKAQKRGKGTKDSPNIVNAMDTYRMVGCICEEDDTNIKWFWLFENKPKRCECGHWFQLKKHQAPEKWNMPA